MAYLITSPGSTTEAIPCHIDASIKALPLAAIPIPDCEEDMSRSKLLVNTLCIITSVRISLSNSIACTIQRRHAIRPKVYSPTHKLVTSARAMSDVTWRQRKERDTYLFKAFSHFIRVATVPHKSVAEISLLLHQVRAVMPHSKMLAGWNGVLIVHDVGKFIY